MKILNQFEKFKPKIKFDQKHNYPSPSQPIRACKCTMAGLETINFRNSQPRSNKRNNEDHMYIITLQGTLYVIINTIILQLIQV